MYGSMQLVIVLTILHVFDPSLGLQIPVASERAENMVHAHTVVAEHGEQGALLRWVYIYGTETAIL
jgi:hypothetical protein